MTGIIVFVLGNVRGQMKERIELQAQQLTDLHEIQKSIYNDIPDRNAQLFMNKGYDLYDCSQQMILEALEYMENVKKLDLFILKQFLIDTNTDINEVILELNKLKEEYVVSNMIDKDAWVLKSSVISTIQETTDWFELQLRQTEVQLQEINTIPL